MPIKLVPDNSTDYNFLNYVRSFDVAPRPSKWLMNKFLFHGCCMEISDLNSYQFLHVTYYTTFNALQKIYKARAGPQLYSPINIAI